jgi:hypothetical protein
MASFKNIFHREAPDGLVQTVLMHIEQERIREAKVRVGVLIVALAASLGGCIVALEHAIMEFGASAFPSYVSLLISDRWEVLAYWKQFLAAVSESIPLVGVSLFIIAVIAALFFLKNLIQNMYQLRTYTL